MTLQNCGKSLHFGDRLTSQEGEPVSALPQAGLCAHLTDLLRLLVSTVPPLSYCGYFAK